MAIGGVFAVIGFYFFVTGLDENNDYLRINHGMWHLTAGVFVWNILDAVKTEYHNDKSKKSTRFLI
jgi:predicted membrane channel-forming protein YqfA (hemolysin III family)